MADRHCCRCADWRMTGALCMGAGLLFSVLACVCLSSSEWWAAIGYAAVALLLAGGVAVNRAAIRWCVGVDHAARLPGDEP